MANPITLLSDYIRMRVKTPPSARRDLPIVDKEDELVTQLENNDDRVAQQLNDFRTLSEDRETQYQAYDDMSNDSVVAAALEIYADDCTAYDEKGRIIWVESDDENITKAGNRLLDILEIPERAWKHIYQACKYGDLYIKMFRDGDIEEEDVIQKHFNSTSNTVRVVNDVKDGNVIHPYVEYVEEVDDPATMFDLRKRGKTAGFIEVPRKIEDTTSSFAQLVRRYTINDVKVYRPDRVIHIAIGENLSRNPETVTIELDSETATTYRVNRGKSILYDVYPIQRELQLLEDSLLLNRLTRSSLIRLMEIEVGDMPKKEVNDYLRRLKNLIEHHVALDKGTGSYRSFQSPGPIDNVIYIPVKNGKGSVSVNNLGGDVNVRDIADIDYFNNKRSGALKIPKAFLGEDMDGSGLSNGGSLTKLSARYARTIKRIQTAYIRGITTMLNLFFMDKKLDYVNKFKVRMASPSTQEDLERAELVQSNIELISSIMSLLESLNGDTQKKVLKKLVEDILKMPEISEIIKEDNTPEEEVSIDGEMGDGPDLDLGGDSAPVDDTGSSDEFDAAFGSGGNDSAPDEGGFTEDEYSAFEDDL